MYFGKFDVAHIQVDFGKIVPHPKQNKKNKKWKEQNETNTQTSRFTKAISLLPKEMSLACVTLEGYDNILNAKNPNIKLFSIPIVLACKMFNALKVDSKGYKLSLQLLEPFYIDK